VVPSQTNSLYHSQQVNGAGPDTQEDEPKLTTHLGMGTHIHGLRIAYPEEAVEICVNEGCLIGRGVENHITLDSPSVNFLQSAPSLSFLSRQRPKN
jgi:hypothetical protein